MRQASAPTSCLAAAAAAANSGTPAESCVHKRLRSNESVVVICAAALCAAASVLGLRREAICRLCASIVSTKLLTFSMSSVVSEARRCRTASSAPVTTSSGGSAIDSTRHNAEGFIVDELEPLRVSLAGGNKSSESPSRSECRSPSTASSLTPSNGFLFRCGEIGAPAPRLRTGISPDM
eukprot:5571685-Pleurochrysis_carterae.AAC.1